MFSKEGLQGKETGRVMSSHNEILVEDEVNHGGRSYFLSQNSDLKKGCSQ